MTPFRPSRSAAAGVVILAALAGLGMITVPAAAQSAQSTAPDGETRPTAPSDAMQSRSAARSRMRECGHQFSSMKKTGAAAGMTWKDFSQGCFGKQ